MSRLNPQRGVPPEHADASKAKQYLNNSIWHTNYLIQVFDSEAGHEKVSKYLREAAKHLQLAKEAWKNE